jgi:hypothetical protein
MVKVRLPPEEGAPHWVDCEWVWVNESSYNTGEILNLPVFNPLYKYKDVVEFDPSTREVVRLFRDGGYTATRLVRFSSEFHRTRAKWQHKGYVVERLTPNVIGPSKKDLRRVKLSNCEKHRRCQGPLCYLGHAGGQGGSWHK